MNSRKPGQNASNKVKRYKRADSKKIMILMVTVIAAVTIICVSAVALVSKLNEPTENRDPTYTFYEADYDYNILEDENYLALDRTVKFEDPDTRITVSLDNGDISEVPTNQHKPVAVLMDFIDYAINGKTEELNSLFSEEYIEAEGELKMDFTMQQLYNIKITYVETLSQDIDGETYVSYDYWLEYMIRQNNGTFRHDMGSDCIRKEYVRVTEREGEMKIDVLAPYKTASTPQSTIGVDEILSIAAIAILIMSIFAAIITLALKSSKKK